MIPKINVTGFEEYQELSAETDLGEVGGRMILKPSWMYYVLGLGGEAGEIFEKIKKLYRDHNGIESDEFKKAVASEMGDVLWYMARLADHLGFSFADVPKANIEKLFSRKERGKLQGDGDNR